VSAEFLFSPTVVHADGTRIVGEELDPLAGAVATAPAGTADPDSTVAIVVRLTGSRAGRYTLSGVRLTYRLNGGSPQTRTGIDVVDTICAADPAPADCPEAAT